MKKIIAVLLAAAMLVTLAACGSGEGGKEKLGMSESPLSAPAVEKFDVPAEFKLGVILLHDKDSTYDLNFLNAVYAVKDALGLSDEQVIIKQNIPEDNACTEAANELADKGCKVIFADSFGHETPLMESAKNHPEVQYCHATGNQAHTCGLSNFHNAFASIYEGRYLAGIAAGLKLNEIKAAGKLKGEKPLIGYVGAFTYAEVMSGYTSFYLGAKSVCPDVQMKVQFTGSWYDEEGEKNAANVLIAAGCDLISQHADSLGAPTACEDAGIPNISYNGSTYDAGENTFIISSAINWAPYFELIIKNTVNGEAIPVDWTGTIETGSVILSGINLDVAAEGTEDAIKAAISEFKAGTLKVFDTSKDNFVTVNGEKLSSYMADVDFDAAYEKDTQVIVDGYFSESTFRSAPYFDIEIDGIELLNKKF